MQHTLHNASTLLSATHSIVKHTPQCNTHPTMRQHSQHTFNSETNTLVCKIRSIVQCNTPSTHCSVCLINTHKTMLNVHNVHSAHDVPGTCALYMCTARTPRSVSRLRGARHRQGAPPLRDFRENAQSTTLGCCTLYVHCTTISNQIHASFQISSSRSQ